MDKVYDVTEEEKKSATDVNITYHRPAFFRRVMANAIDFFLFVVLFLVFFTLFGSVMQNTSDYKTKSDYINEKHLASAIYIEDVGNNRIYDIVTYYNSNNTNTTREKKVALSTAINNFITFIGNETDEETRNEVQKNYDDYRLDANLNEKGTPYFIEVNGQIVENEEAITNGTISHKDFYDYAYAPYIDNNCQGYLLTQVPLITSYTRYLSQTIIFIELIPTFLFAGIITWLFIPLFFRRGYKTLGKFIYKIGTVNSNFLNMSRGRFVARFAIFFLGTITLSFFTFGIPMIVSFSMMAFSKSKQSFSDYMLGLYEVETNVDKIYFSKEEILLDHLYKDTSSKDFKLPPKL